MPQLDVSTFLSQVFWLFTSFTILYLLLGKFCIPKFIKIFKKRDSYIDSNIHAAKLAKEKANKLKHDYEKLLTQTAKDRSLLIDKTNKEISLMIESELKKKEEEINKSFALAIENISKFEQDSLKAVDQLAKDTVEEILLVLTDKKISSDEIEKTIEKVRSKREYVI